MIKTLMFLPAALVAAAMPFARPVTVDQPLGPDDWVVDGAHSSVVFKVKHANASWFLGTFDKVDGTVTLDHAAPESGKVSLTIPVESVDTNDQKRDGHLKAPDFFNAKENPQITFESTAIAKKGDVLHVTGELSMAGKTNEVTIPVEHVGDGEFYGARRGYMTTFTLKRSEFGMTYGVEKNVLGDEITLMISLELVHPK